MDDYNHNMNSVDLTDQDRQPYDIQQVVYRTWIPILHWILDQAAINAYKLATMEKPGQRTTLNFDGHCIGGF
jgi:hypothetical protein